MTIEQIVTSDYPDANLFGMYLDNGTVVRMEVNIQLETAIAIIISVIQS